MDEALLQELAKLLPPEDVIKAADETVSILTFVRGTLAGGELFYAYAAISPSKFVAFKLAEMQGGYDLAEFGDILKYDVGTDTPPPEVKAKMEEMYGAYEGFQERLIEAVTEIAKDEQKRSELLDKYTKSKLPKN